MIVLFHSYDLPPHFSGFFVNFSVPRTDPSFIINTVDCKGIVMTALLETAYAEVAKLSPRQQEDFARWMLAELANLQRWNQTALQAADSMEWFAEDSLEENQKRQV
jgi:hypothetical protein